MSSEERAVAIVTGASSGIGAGIARRLSADGFAVAINYSGNQTDAEKLVAEIKGRGGNAVAIKADVGNASEVEALFTQAEQELGPVSVLINNAGRAVRKEISAFSDEEFDSVMRTNLYGTFFAMRQAAKRLKEGGRIVNISMSFQGPPIPGYGVYFASKAAIEEMSRVLSKELGSKGITVNSLRPGPTNTKLFMQGKPPEVIQHFEKSINLGRLGTSEDIAEVVAFLVGPHGAWINGQAFAANGGYW